MFGLWDLSEEQKNNFFNIKDYIIALLFEIIMLFGYMLFGPMIIYLLIKTNVNMKYSIVNYIFLLMILCGSLINNLKKSTQKTIKVINDYTEHVMFPIEHNPAIIEIDEKQRIAVRWTRSKLILFISCILIGGVIIVTLYILKDKREFQIFCFLMMVLLIIVDSIMAKRKSKACVKQEIVIEGYILESVKNEIFEMCNKINISSIQFKMWNNQNPNANSSFDKEGIPQIKISNGLINAISVNSDAKEILLVTIGHELGHIFYRDSICMNRRMKIASIVAIMGYIMIILLLYVSINHPIFWILELILLLLEVVFGNIMTDLRYWEQIAELKADRMAVFLHENGRNAFIDFWTNECKDNKLKNYNIIYQYYKRYIENEAHPAMYRRMEILKTRGKWKVWEYFEHVLIIRKWKLSNRGWNGE